MNVGIEHAGDPPAACFGQPEVYLWFQGSIYDRGLAVGPDDVGESPLPGATHLHYLGTHAGQRHLGRSTHEALGLLERKQSIPRERLTRCAVGQSRRKKDHVSVDDRVRRVGA